ncbi:MAG: ATP synthase F0 subunit B [Thermodesulfobacteriota bacterium]
MVELNLTFFVQLVNFLVLLAILNFLVYRPIREISRKRRERMSAELTEIEEFSSQSEKKIEDYQAALDKARKEGDQVRTDLKTKAVQEEKKILSEAGEEGSQELGAARQEIASERDKARRDLEKQVEDYASMVADKVLINA